MCSFGYVITDEYFNILEKADILINPEAIFHTGAWSKKNREKDPGIELAYPKERFKANPTFPGRYERIQRLLQHDDRKIIGFSHHNDALFLTVACKRYELPVIDYKFYDAQEIFGESRNIVNQVALNAIAEALEVDLSKLVQHRSDDDAEASMLVTKALCEDLGLTIEELIGHCPRCAGEVTAEGKCKYYVREAKRAEKRMRAAAVRSNRMTTKNLEEFKKYVRGLQPDPILELTLRGKKVTLNSPYEYKHFKEACLILGSGHLRSGRARQTLYAASARKKGYRRGKSGGDYYFRGAPDKALTHGEGARKRGVSGRAGGGYARSKEKTHKIAEKA